MSATPDALLRRDAAVLLNAAYVIRRRSIKPKSLATEVMVRTLTRMAANLNKRADDYERKYGL
jgi:hypothetical protein